MVMKKVSAAAKAKRRKHLLKVCESARQHCNKLSDEQNQDLLEQGLKMIYGADAKAQARCR